jgi:hypothetical protein
VEAPRGIAANLHKVFHGFEPDFLHAEFVRVVDDVIGVIKGSIELWPAQVEVFHFMKVRKGLRQLRVANPPSRSVESVGQRLPDFGPAIAECIHRGSCTGLQFACNTSVSGRKF